MLHFRHAVSLLFSDNLLMYLVLSFRTDSPEQRVQIRIRLLLNKQSDQDSSLLAIVSLSIPLYALSKKFDSLLLLACSSSRLSLIPNI